MIFKPMQPHINLVNGLFPFIFVIPPTDIKFSQTQNHKPVEIIDLGEVLRDGIRQSIRVSWSGFFPAINSHFYTPLLNPLGAKPSADYLRDCMQKNVKFKLIIPEYLEYLNCKIESFEVEYRDHTGDAYYNISLVEDRQGMSITVDLVTGLRSRL